MGVCHEREVSITLAVCRAVHGCESQVRVTSFAASTVHAGAMAATDQTQSWRPNGSNRPSWSVIVRSRIFRPYHLVRLRQVLNCQVRDFQRPILMINSYDNRFCCMMDQVRLYCYL